MRDLRLVTVSEDGRHLLLAASDGEEFQLPIDEGLTAAVRGDRSRLGQLQIELESSLRPAEIQARIRAGASAEEVAAVAGVPVERVRRYEGPVLAEREHIAAAARATAVRRQGDGGPVPTLEDITTSRLEARGVSRDTLRWDSWRRDDGRWTVRLAYRAPGARNDEHAAWIFDPVRRGLTPDGEDARKLSQDEDDLAARRLARVPGPDDVYDQEAAAAAARRLADGAAAAEPAAAVSALPAPDAAAEPVQVDATPADADSAEAAPAVTPVPDETAVDGSAEPAAEDAEAAAEPAAPGKHAARTSGRSKRPSVPSWDEIVFGARKRDS
jgi:hypothetical protein